MCLNAILTYPTALHPQHATPQLLNCKPALADPDLYSKVWLALAGTACSVCVVAAILQACFVRASGHGPRPDEAFESKQHQNGAIGSSTHGVVLRPSAVLRALHAALSDLQAPLDHGEDQAAAVESAASIREHSSSCDQVGVTAFATTPHPLHAAICSLDLTSQGCTKQHVRQWLAFIAQYHASALPCRGLLKQVAVLFTDWQQHGRHG